MATLKKEYYELHSVLEINRPIHVLLPGAKKEAPLKSSIADFDKRKIMIAPVTRGGVPMQLDPGTTLTVVYFGKDASYEFETEVIGRKKDNNVILPVLENPRKCWRVQRRDFYRLPIDLTASIRKGVIAGEGTQKVIMLKGDPVTCYLEDISGGGISFYAPVSFEDATHVEIDFALPVENGVVNMSEFAEIVRARKVNAAERRHDFDYMYGARFITISEDQQNNIVRFVMHAQIEQRKALKKSAGKKK